MTDIRDGAFIRAVLPHDSGTVSAPLGSSRLDCAALAAAAWVCAAARALRRPLQDKPQQEAGVPESEQLHQHWFVTS